MSLASGTRLDSYEIVAPIGAGGPPSRTVAFGHRFGASAVAQARIWL